MATESVIPGVDFAKLDAADRAKLLDNFVSSGKILAKCTETTWDDLLFRLLDSGTGPLVVGADARAEIQAAVAAGSASGLSPEMIMLLVQLASQLFAMFRKK